MGQTLLGFSESWRPLTNCIASACRLSWHAAQCSLNRTSFFDSLARTARSSSSEDPAFFAGNKQQQPAAARSSFGMLLDIANVKATPHVLLARSLPRALASEKNSIRWALQPHLCRHASAKTSLQPIYRFLLEQSIWPLCHILATSTCHRWPAYIHLIYLIVIERRAAAASRSSTFQLSTASPSKVVELNRDEAPPSSLACHTPAHRERVHVCLRLAVWLRNRPDMPNSVALQQCPCMRRPLQLQHPQAFNILQLCLTGATSCRWVHRACPWASIAFSRTTCRRPAQTSTCPTPRRTL